MNPRPERIVSLPRASLVALGLLACSSSQTAPGPFGPGIDGEVRVANGTDRPFAFFAIAADLDPLLDPVPELDVDQAAITLVPPGEERPVGELSGREEAPKGGVAVFLYSMIGQSRRARFTRVELVSGRAIRAAGGRILIDVQ
jgi:hypothetical protein